MFYHIYKHTNVYFCFKLIYVIRLSVFFYVKCYAFIIWMNIASIKYVFCKTINTKLHWVIHSYTYT